LNCNPTQEATELVASNIRAFAMKVNNPRVTTYNPQVRKEKIGLITAFTIPKMSATNKTVTHLFPPMVIPGNSQAVTAIAATFTINLVQNDFILSSI
jgi:hypothetical protein